MSREFWRRMRITSGLLPHVTALTSLVLVGCIPMAPAASTPAAATEAASTPAAATEAAKPAAPAIPQLTVKAEGFVTTTAEASTVADIDVTSDALTDVWLRMFNDEGNEVRPLFADVCDPAAPRDCIHLKPSDTKFGLVGTRRLHIAFEAPTKVTMQLVTGWKRLAWTALAFGAPAADATVKQRNAKLFGIQEHMLQSGWTEGHAAFTRLPASFQVYAASAFAAGMRDGAVPREVAIGEPLIQVGRVLLRANGEVLVPRLPRGIDLDSVLTATRPVKIVMPPAWADTDGGRSDVSMYHYPWGDDASEFAGFDAPEIDAFLKARAPVKACIGRELEKRGSGFGYDIALYKKDGSLKKVQSLTSYIEDQIYKACNVAKLDKQRAKVRAAMRARALLEIEAKLSAG